MNRIEAINKITAYAARFVVEVEGFNATNKYDINIHAETFLIPVLNKIFDIELENLNTTQRKNYPAIDLADFKNRVAFQITATSDLSKIESTLTTFFSHNLQKDFDTLYFYIITHKKEKYNDAKIKDLLPENFVFNSDGNVIDKDVLLKRIDSIISTPKLESICRIYQSEFSDTKIELRKKEFERGYLNKEPENIYSNLLKIEFPDTIYKADLDIDEDDIITDYNNYLELIGKRTVKKLKKPTLIKEALRKYKYFARDWVLYGDAVYTFKDLSDESEPLSNIIDHGTITPLNCEEFYTNEDHNRVFKNLLRNNLIELCRRKDIEWFEKKNIFRFRNNKAVPRQKQIRWKGKKESTKTVIFEMINKKEKHIICFRSLAFKSSFLNISDDWFLVLNPTWSFTDPGGYRQSRFESSYMTGIKGLENNQSVFNYFRFFGYYLSYKDLFTDDYPYLKVKTYFPLSLSPRLDEKTWKPMKDTNPKTQEILADLKVDNELIDNTLF
ncbi:SMEK domain-containing protein [Dysgonomonas sp. GY75]|uniref:SMEK domain-containing protein n=1 Tax=Dysgonomonas sp. GY75 TaxID=2780419 RepID=UPI001883B5A9|nr:SMEK domain-containing protein [Dysgonomonas sp. GY75]MBF0648580.1 SMEK domain-containing protein [Dysgonomonas sp. GY75]